ncbi:hypothetical protein [Niastella sp. OAS944]|uniref:hypothetical protein n=1 Tax=Niastella sp. OAS944 TaxID=2664089 RepID=UPI00346EBE50|nr:hypothetical protein [Chitinophagaceae bacterium OAS944]
MSNINIKRSFKQYLLYDRQNRLKILLAASAIVLQFTVFKYLYPFANYIHHDSFVYINAAHENLDISTHPIGYSKFLRLFSVFNRTDLALTAGQYLLIQSSMLYLLFTIFYFTKLGNITQYLLLIFMVFNPLFLHLSNLVSSDGLFLALSCFWFGLLIWIIYRPSNQILLWHAIVLLISFTVRYNALIYPIISIAAFWLSGMPLSKKIYGLMITGALCSSFIFFNIYKYKKLSGYKQFTPFSGWQLANNALYAYRYVDKKDRQPVPKKFEALDNMVRKFFYKTRNDPFYYVEENQANTFYMWTKGLPLRRYQDSLFKNVKTTDQNKLKLWATMAPFYRDYGKYIVQTYPLYYMRYFIWPNSKKFFALPIEFLAFYNSQTDTVTERTQKWFGYKNRIVTTNTGENKISILDFYSVLSGIISLLMLFGLLYYIMLKGWKYNLLFSKIIFVGGIFWLLNAVFSVCSASIALRFQSFPILLSTIFVLLLVDWLIQLMKALKLTDMNKLKIKNQVYKGIDSITTY